MILRIILATTFFLIGYISAAQPNQPAELNRSIGQSNANWIQTVLKNWETVCTKHLLINPQPLPWIIFYDSTRAFHINPDTNLLPPSAIKQLPIQFGSQSYRVILMAHAGSVWVPGRDPISVVPRPAVTMPYDEYRKSFFMAPLPSFFRKLAPADQAGFLDLLFLGINSHELTHTRQLPFVLPQLLDIQKKYKLPENLDDNLIERLFEKNEAYKKLFTAEKQHFWNAYMAANMDSCRREITKGLTLMKQRKGQFFTGDKLGYTYLDDIFLSLEGSAMWVQYQVTMANAPRDQPAHQTLYWLVQRTDSWVQEEGLVLFLLIDRLVPNWQSQFFGKTLPYPFDVLQRAVSQKPQK
ncbi:hypothetical protein IC229_22915 [Spirosoma sp. BT702]|uniref:Uncharacterized protein n=1 Tax=Spirosoma profusum TaxID=2771354 RepID=A0A927ATH3_9BACT|nr:hypothetical protein [Spirosoma profusum]MBD2703515.1 hypothetical protein [Spirosoma profusum]